MGVRGGETGSPFIRLWCQQSKAHQYHKSSLLINHMTFGTNYSVLLHARLRGFLWCRRADSSCSPWRSSKMCPPRSALWDLGLPTPSATRGGNRFYWRQQATLILQGTHCIYFHLTSASFCPYPRWKTTVAKTPHIWARHICNYKLSYIGMFIITNFGNYKALLLPAFVITKLLNN